MLDIRAGQSGHPGMIAERQGRLGYDGPVTSPAIRPMTLGDVPAATAALVHADFGDRRTWFEFATSQAACRPIVAELDGEIVGTGVGTANGTVGWIGTIWVEPRLRGAGLGRALTQIVIDDLEAAGCRTLLLVATIEGLRLYERMGFELQTRYRILEATGLPGNGSPDGGIRPFTPLDLPTMVALDGVATGEDRRHVIERFASQESTKILEVQGLVRAFVTRAPWGGGATIAADPADAMRILDARRRTAGPGGRVRVGLVEENATGLDLLAALGLTLIWSAPRLIRGEPLDWRPGWIWGQFNHALG